MGYQSLYRQYRPQGFSRGYVGQEHIVKTLQNSLKSGQLAHAYLFSGPRGTGKTSTAKILAKAVNCLSDTVPVSEPCNECQLCLAVNQGTAMDVIEMDAATNRGIEEVRDLRERVKYAPALSRYKVYIIDEVHMLTAEAFNALLKTLEEPPGHIIFILATTEPHKIPATILSRCQRFEFHPLTDKIIAAHLQEIALEAGTRLAPDSAQLLAFRAQGSMRDGIGLLEQVIAYSQGDIGPEQVRQALGTVDRASLAAFAGALAAAEIGSVLRLLDDFGNQGLDYRQLLTDLLEMLRERLLQVTGARPALAGEAEINVKTAPEIMGLMELVAAGLQDSKRWTHPRLAVELTAIKICAARSAAPEPPAKTAAVPKKSMEQAPIPLEKWEEVLALVREESIASYAWLKEARAFLGADCLILEYPGNYKLHCENILKAEHRRLVVPALKRVLGIDDYRVTMKE